MMGTGSQRAITNAAGCAVLTPVPECAVPRKGDGSGWLRAGALVAP
jgi:hypothetical protein